MFTVSMESKALLSQLAAFAGQMPFAASMAVNRTAQKVKTAQVTEMRSVFDRPTPFTLRSLQLTPSTKQRLEASVWFKSQDVSRGNGHYLEPQVFGGGRSLKTFEKLLQSKGIMPGGMYAVPGQGLADNNLLDRYGNIPVGIMRQMMSVLKANRDIGVKSNITDRSKRRNRKRANYFVVGGKGGQSLGIARRSPGGNGGAGWSESVVWFVRAPRYKQRYQFHDVGRRTVDAHLANEVAKAIEYAIRTAR